MTRFPHIAVAGLSVMFVAFGWSVVPTARGADDEKAPAPAPAAEAAADEAVERDAPAADADAALQDDEPPLEFELEVGGKAVDVQLDRPATVDVGGKKVEVRLRAKPERLFRGGGVSFRYPRNHGFEVEREPGEDGAVTWTFDGNNNVLILLRNAEPIDPDELGADIVQSMSEQYGQDNTVMAPTKIKLGGREVAGTRVEVKVAANGSRLVQDVFAWQTEAGEGPTYAMILQDTPPEPGATSEETKQVRELLARTFKHDKPAAAREE